VEHLLTLLPWLGVPVAGTPQCNLYVEEEARTRVSERLGRLGIDWQKFFLVHPTATLFTKQWPPAHFAHIGDQLSEQYGMPVIFTSAPNEVQVLRDIQGHARTKHCYWSDLALNELFALIEGCRLFLGNDSGPTHAASALHRPVVVVWGSSNAAAWHPWNTDHELIRSDLPCMPCPGYSCAVFGAPRCILEIRVERVMEACQRILARTPAK
jgi:ADP-heptose:LPS heptosyltransferase